MILTENNSNAMECSWNRLCLMKLENMRYAEKWWMSENVSESNEKSQEIRRLSIFHESWYLRPIYEAYSYWMYIAP